MAKLGSDHNTHNLEVCALLDACGVRREITRHKTTQHNMDSATTPYRMRQLVPSTRIIASQMRRFMRHVKHLNLWIAHATRSKLAPANVIRNAVSNAAQNLTADGVIPTTRPARIAIQRNQPVEKRRLVSKVRLQSAWSIRVLMEPSDALSTLTLA
jgi:hypothetical protein